MHSWLFKSCFIFILLGCQSRAGEGALIGGGGGAIIGGVAGGGTGALIGAGAGAVGGAIIGAALDQSEVNRMNRNDQYRYKSGQPISKEGVKNLISAGVSEDKIKQATKGGRYCFSEQEENDLMNQGASSDLISYFRGTCSVY